MYFKYRKNSLNGYRLIAKRMSGMDIRGAGLNSANFFLADKVVLGSPSKNSIKFGVFHEVNN